jgi:16S rRNA (guanine527-N7)-methyltransferase
MVGRMLEVLPDQQGGQAQAQGWLQDNLNVSRETLDKLEAYSALLVKWAPKINLIGTSTIETLWTRHIIDSAQLLWIAGPAALRWVDFGSGAGLPGLIIAILLSETPASEVTLVEPSAKRCAFLREAARRCGAKIIIMEQKIEEVEARAVDIVTARAFAPLDALLAHTYPWLQFGGKALFPKGQDVQREQALASTNWAFRHKLHTSLTDARGCILEVEGLTGVTRS